ncbi:amidohydrolase family protein [Parachitinimonas caeni]|uniref:Amidohydrolase family protein n=1 Tax=Parachitinimonas caeni TaxID=3031301 RepID=A0ABT7E0A8_9NEIS|nr:amidohydrolase family protein [Parachitinimonas caeni]MDK2125748.1 amidohydrolase family protein [Parachitinimonas caeni]
MIAIVSILRPRLLQRLVCLSLLTAPLVGIAAKKEEFITFQFPAVALTHVELIDGSGNAVQADMTILIRNGRIEAVGKTGELAVPPDTPIKDLSGHSLTPGLVLMHEHIFYPTANGAYGAMFDSFPKLYLAGGATTIRTAGSISPYADINLKQDIASGEAIGPDIEVSAPFLNGNTPFVMQMSRLATPEQAREMVAYWSAAGADSFKAYMHLTRPQLRAIVEEAHKHGKKVTGHLCAVGYHEAIDLGIDNIEHGFFAMTDVAPDKVSDQCPSGDGTLRMLNTQSLDSSQIGATILKLVRRKVALTSTLGVFESFASGRPQAPKGALDLLIPELRQQYLIRWNALANQPDNLWSQLLPKGMAWEKRFHDAGGLLMAGSDPTGYGGVIPGYSSLRQLELLQEAGFSLPQVVRIASLNGATYLGRADEIGSIAPGKRADMVLFKGSLSKDPKALQQLVWTMKAGVAYDRAKILAAYQGKIGLQ